MCVDIVSTEDFAASVSEARAFRSMQIGQNSTAPENSLPQPGHTRLSTAFTDLTALQTLKCEWNVSSRTGRKESQPLDPAAAGPRSRRLSRAWCESSSRPPLADHGRVSRRSGSFSKIAGENLFRNKIPEAPGSRSSLQRVRSSASALEEQNLT